MSEKEKMVRETEITLDKHEVRLMNAMNILEAEKKRSCDKNCTLSKKISPSLPPFLLPSPPLPSPPLSLSLHSP